MNLPKIPSVATPESGATLIELIVAASMMVVITGATVSLLVSTLNNQSRVTDKAHQAGEARVALRKMVDDVRQGSTIATASATELKINTYVHAASCGASPSVSAPAILCQVAYKCAKETSKTTFQCTRTVGSTAVKVATGLSSGSVFIYTPTGSGTAATYITAKLVLPASSGTYNTTLENGAALRNSPTNLSY